jgi:hypothetical protein
LPALPKQGFEGIRFIRVRGPIVVEKRQHLVHARLENTLPLGVGGMRVRRRCWALSLPHKPRKLRHQLALLKSGHKFLQQLVHEVLLLLIGEDLGKGGRFVEDMGHIPTVWVDNALLCCHNHTVRPNDLPTLVTALFLPTHIASFPGRGGTRGY